MLDKMATRTQLIQAGIGAVILIPLIWFLFNTLFGTRRSRKALKTRPRVQASGRKDSPEVVIVGSGIIGSAMATVLARDGQKVTIIERDMKEPDRIVGELMQPGGLATLADLGLSECLTGLEEIRTDGFVLFDPVTKEPLVFRYPDSDCGKAQSARCFHHGRFIMSLRKAAMAENNVTYIEATVSKLLDDEGRIVGVEYKQKGDAEPQKLYAPLTVVADGAFSKLRKQLSGADGGRTPNSYFLGFKMKNCPDFKVHHAEGFWCGSTPTIIYRIAPDTTRLVANIKTTVQPTNPREFLMGTVYPHLPDHIKKPFADTVQDESARLRLVPTYYMPSAPVDKSGVLLVGDALNMRHPFTACGMTAALKDIKLWRETLAGIETLDDDALSDALYAFQKRRSAYSLAINLFAQCVFQLLTARDRYMSKLRLGGYKYIMLGGECLNGPLRIFSAMTTKPLPLLYLFIRVNLYTAYYLLKTAPWYSKPLAIFDGLMVFLTSSRFFFSLLISEYQSVKRL